MTPFSIKFRAWNWNEIVISIPKGVMMETDSCLDPGIPVNGKRFGNNFAIGTRVTFSCDQGYTLSDEKPIVCERNHQWNHALPSCDGSVPRFSTLQPFLPLLFPVPVRCTDMHCSTYSAITPSPHTPHPIHRERCGRHSALLTNLSVLSGGKGTPLWQP